MSQHQPGWANQPQQPSQSQWNAQTQPMWGAPPPPTPKKRRAGKVVGLGCLGIVGLFIIMGIVAGAVSSGSKNDSTTSNSHSTSKGAAPAKAGTPAQTGSPAQMLADLDGDKRDPSSYQTALDALTPKCKQTPKEIAAIANAMVELLRKNGVDDETDYSALVHLNQSIPAGSPKMDCQDIAGVYVTMREGGTS
ncbi:hypothetical protein ACFC8N_42820 [Streptomyces sp. NPDC055966]|uniref:hypothetical protein n=1 Tax=Streptomyces sp. NPDC055966 TaxID=3345669 RepID=UPI0035E37C90